MYKNTNLGKAAKAKNDEFYTSIETIEKELKHYTDHFKDKVVYCNCDDPFRSNFVKFFLSNMNRLGIKELIATGYYISQTAGIKYQTPKIPYSLRVSDTTKYLKENQTDLDDQGIKELFENEKENILTQIYGDESSKAGDFRSEEAIALLKEADIVCTNPPFSLFREYIAQLIEYNKDFLIIGNLNAITYKNVFPLIHEEKLWLGATRPDKFIQSLETGKDVSALTRWFTNIDYANRYKYVDLNLRMKYEGHEDIYPKYDNYDAIEVSKVRDIPYDYEGVIGVPITFMDKFCPEQFDLVGISGTLAGSIEIDGKIRTNPGRFYVNGKKKYDRILIRRKY